MSNCCSESEDKTKKKKKWIFFSLIIFMLFSKPAFAHCPACTVATGLAVGTARIYGVSDIILGVLAGAFVISTLLWFLKKAKERIPYQTPILIILSILLTIAGFYYGITNPANLILGTLFGSIVSLGATTLHQAVREGNQNKNFIPFQGMVFVLLSALITIAIINAAGFA